MSNSSGITNGQLVSMWLWVQTGDRLAGLMRFADLITEWCEREAERAGLSVEEYFCENPEAMFVFEDQEEMFAKAQTVRVMCASLINALNAVAENLLLESCLFAGITSSP